MRLGERPKDETHSKHGRRQSLVVCRKGREQLARHPLENCDPENNAAATGTTRRDQSSEEGYQERTLIALVVLAMEYGAGRANEVSRGVVSRFSGSSPSPLSANFMSYIPVGVALRYASMRVPVTELVPMHGMGKSMKLSVPLDTYAEYAASNQVDFPYYPWERDFVEERELLLEDFWQPAWFKVTGPPPRISSVLADLSI